MPLEGHPDNCECCVKISFTPGARGSRKRTTQDADLSTFLPVARNEDEEGEEEAEAEPLEGIVVDEEDALLSTTLFKAFDAHVDALDTARKKRIEALSFKSALEDDGDAEINEDATQDEIDGLGIWQAGDEFQGDVNYRTLQKLLTRVDQRGFERSAQQLEFHVAFMKAAARVIYRGSWETERPAIMKRYGWEKSNSEVLISTPRRFGKTFSCVPRVPASCQRVCSPRARVCLAALPSFVPASRSRSVWRSVRRKMCILASCPLAHTHPSCTVVFSPARRASRKLLERIVEFVRLAGGEKRICEYNQEACRLTAFDGKKSLIRSFPCAVFLLAPPS